MINRQSAISLSMIFERHGSIICDKVIPNHDTVRIVNDDAIYAVSVGCVILDEVTAVFVRVVISR